MRFNVYCVSGGVSRPQRYSTSLFSIAGRFTSSEVIARTFRTDDAAFCRITSSYPPNLVRSRAGPA
jgi:hypothetical protein